MIATKRQFLGIPEVRRQIVGPRLRGRFPKKYKVFFVRNSRSTLIFEPDRWVKKYQDEALCEDRFSIEIENTQGLVMAAVGWYDYHYGNRHEIHTYGTFVSPGLRRRGIARALWETMMDYNPGLKIDGTAASHQGFTLLTSLQELYPDRVTFTGDPSLDDLRDKDLAG